jgi:hypothetical protein
MFAVVLFARDTLEGRPARLGCRFLRSKQGINVARRAQAAIPNYREFPSILQVQVTWRELVQTVMSKSWLLVLQVADEACVIAAPPSLLSILAIHRRWRLRKVSIIEDNVANMKTQCCRSADVRDRLMTNKPPPGLRISLRALSASLAIVPWTALA